MFIASRNQVDADELGGGYVNGWNQFSFIDAIKEVAKEVDFDGLYYVCRDHGDLGNGIKREMITYQQKRRWS